MASYYVIEVLDLGDHGFAGEYFREGFLYPRLPYIIILFFVFLAIFTFLFNKYSSRTSEVKITFIFTLSLICSVFIGEALIYAVFFLMYLSIAYAIKQDIKKIRLISPEETIWAILMVVFIVFVGSLIIADYFTSLLESLDGYTPSKPFPLQKDLLHKYP